MNLLLSALFLSISLSQAVAASQSLYVKRNNKWFDVAEVIRQEAISDDNDQFCYSGNPQAVMTSMKKWAKQTENFFCDGCGGGYAFRKTELFRGAATYDIKLVIEDEVVPGEMRFVIIKACK